MYHLFLFLTVTMSYGGNLNDVIDSIPVEIRTIVFNGGIQMVPFPIAVMLIAVAYPFLQKHFVAGLTIGGVKG